MRVAWGPHAHSLRLTHCQGSGVRWLSQRSGSEIEAEKWFGRSPKPIDPLGSEVLEVRLGVGRVWQASQVGRLEAVYDLGEDPMGDLGAPRGRGGTLPIYMKWGGGGIRGKNAPDICTHLSIQEAKIIFFVFSSI